MRVVILMLLVTLIGTGCDNPNNCVISSIVPLIAKFDCEKKLSDNIFNKIFGKKEALTTEEKELLDSYTSAGNKIEGKKFGEAIKEARLWKIKRESARSAAFNDIKDSLRKVLLDPDSAQYGKFYYSDAIPGTACVEINAHNQFGGFTGYKLLLLKKENDSWKISADWTGNEFGMAFCKVAEL